MRNPRGIQGVRPAAWLWLALLIFAAGPAAGADVTLGWNPNSEADLAGYGIYSRKDADGPPYDLAGYVALEELLDRNNPTFIVGGLENGFSYYFAATAYDSSGNESYFSNSACARVGDQIERCADSGNGFGGNAATGSGSGGGGGGGCFIRTLSP